MLGKLLKYEYKATARIFLPFYAGILILSLLMSFNNFSGSDSSLLSLNLMMMLFPTMLTIAFVGLTVMTIITVVKRFDSNLLSDEGYLMFTLPVRISQLINSKLIISLLWGFLTGIIFIFSMLLIFRREIAFSDLYEGFKELFSQQYILPNLFILLIGSILMYANFLLMVYASLSVSQAYSITKSRILGGILVYILLSIIFGVLQNVGLFSFAYLYQENFNLWFENLFKDGNLMHPAVMAGLLYIFLKNALLYYITQYHMKYKLNLD